MTRREEGGTSAWAVFEPFSNEVWWMIGASVGFGALVMFSLHAIDSGLPKLESARGVPELRLPHDGRDPRRRRVRSLPLPRRRPAVPPRAALLPARDWSAYTANLAAFLLRASARARAQDAGGAPRRDGVQPVRAFAGSYTSYVGSFVFPADAPATEQAGLEWARDALQNGECDAIMEIKSSAKLFALEHCDTMQLHPDVEFAEIVDFNLMRASDLDLWQNVSEAILLTLKRPAYAAMVQDTSASTSRARQRRAALPGSPCGS